MRIDPGNPNIPPIPGRKPGRVAPRVPGSAPVSSSEKSSETTESAEVASLTASLGEIPEVRSDVVEEVRQRLSRGEHLTRDAAERTASAILADLVSFIGQ